MIETVLTIQKTVNNLFGVNPFFGPNLTILLEGPLSLAISWEQCARLLVVDLQREHQYTV